MHLLEADALHLLGYLSAIHVPKAVISEVEYWRPNQKLPDWLKISSLTQPFSEQAFAWRRAGLLDPGEAEAIALAQQLSAEWLLTDDAAARVLAESLGLEAHGSLGIVLWAAAEGLTDRNQSTDILNRLIRSSLWLSPRVVRHAWEALNKIFQD